MCHDLVTRKFIFPFILPSFLGVSSKFGLNPKRVSCCIILINRSQLLVNHKLLPSLEHLQLDHISAGNTTHTKNRTICGYHFFHIFCCSNSGKFFLLAWFLSIFFSSSVSISISFFLCFCTTQEAKSKVFIINQLSYEENEI